MPRKGEEEGWPAKGAKRKKGRAKTGQNKSVILLNVEGPKIQPQENRHCKTRILRGLVKVKL